MDGDGDLDLVTDADDGPEWYENQGSQEKPVMQLRGKLVEARLPGHSPTPNLADWNGDGKIDLMIGAEDGFFYYYDHGMLSVASAERRRARGGLSAAAFRGGVLYSDGNRFHAPSSIAYLTCRSRTDELQPAARGEEGSFLTYDHHENSLRRDLRRRICRSLYAEQHERHAGQGIDLWGDRGVDRGAGQGGQGR